MMEAHYYKVPVRKGQEVRAIGQIQKASTSRGRGHNNQTFSISVYGGDFTLLKREALMIAEVPKTIQTLRARATRQRTASSTSGSPRATTPRPTALMPREIESRRFQAQALPVFAADSGWVTRQRSPRHARGNPRRRRLGRQCVWSGGRDDFAPSIAATDIKVGEVVFYKTKVKKGEKLRVAIAAQKPWWDVVNGIKGTYTVTAYDDDQVQVAQKKLDVDKNPPEAQVFSFPRRGRARRSNVSEHHLRELRPSNQSQRLSAETGLILAVQLAPPRRTTRQTECPPSATRAPLKGERSLWTVGASPHAAIQLLRLTTDVFGVFEVRLVAATLACSDVVLLAAFPITQTFFGSDSLSVAAHRYRAICPLSNRREFDLMKIEFQKLVDSGTVRKRTHFPVSTASRPGASPPRTSSGSEQPRRRKGRVEVPETR